LVRGKLSNVPGGEVPGGGGNSIFTKKKHRDKKKKKKDYPGVSVSNGHGGKFRKKEKSGQYTIQMRKVCSFQKLISG